MTIRKKLKEILLAQADDKNYNVHFTSASKTMLVSSASFVGVVGWFDVVVAVLLLSTTNIDGVTANDNGLALKPPLGWRSWNLFNKNVDQGMIEDIMDGMVKRTRIDHLGNPTSLCDLGYCDVGLDDGWQHCDHPNAAPDMHYHTEQGKPLIDVNKFPDMRGMTEHAHSLNLTAGWYGNNCICNDKCHSEEECYTNIKGDVETFLEFNFDSWKMDGCGGEDDLVLVNRLLQEMSPERPILVENCHGQSAENKPNRDLPPAEGCPYNMYRTSKDIRAFYASLLHNLDSIDVYHKNNESYPGCWAFPDMLVLGTWKSMTDQEMRSHFGAWSIVSSPLILSHDVNDDHVTDQIWDLISNREVLAINQAYVGDSGGLYAWSEKTVDHLEFYTDGRPDHIVTVPARQYFSKPLGGGTVAVLLMNCIDDGATMTAIFRDIPGLLCKQDDCQYHVRDVWNHRDIGFFDDSYSVPVDGHDAAYLILDYVERTS